jgi:hypothetical protein
MMSKRTADLLDLSYIKQINDQLFHFKYKRRTGRNLNTSAIKFDSGIIGG